MPSSSLFQVNSSFSSIFHQMPWFKSGSWFWVYVLCCSFAMEFDSLFICCVHLFWSLILKQTSSSTMFVCCVFIYFINCCGSWVAAWFSNELQVQYCLCAMCLSTSSIVAKVIIWFSSELQIQHYLCVVCSYVSSIVVEVMTSSSSENYIKRIKWKL